MPFGDKEIEALAQILLSDNPPKTYRNLLDNLFIGVSDNMAPTRTPEAIRLRGRIRGATAFNRFAPFYKAKRLRFPVPTNITIKELELFEAVYLKFPTERKLQEALNDFFAAGAANRIQPTKR